jgi:hypothetical protein
MDILTETLIVSSVFGCCLPALVLANAGVLPDFAGL